VRTIIILIAAAAVVVAAGCGGDAGGSSGSSGGKRVVAGFYPLAFVASQVGGGGVRVQDLTPPGTEPHDLEVSPSDVRDVLSADHVLLLGHGFQPQLERAAGKSGKVIRLLDAPGVDPHPSDPHVWLDPVRFAAVATRVGEVLRQPERARTLVARLHALDREFRAGLAHCAGNEIVTSHEAFRYLAERYGLRQVAITGISPEAEPTPAALRRVVDVVRTTHATTVFSEPLVSKRLAQTVANETGAKTDVLDPIEALTSAERARGDDYFDLMRNNLDALRAGLRCR
jgi:zinc transport system substrate-binding protein